jgi:hypothetical protein
MLFTTILAPSLAILPVLVAGHRGIPGAPRVFGLAGGSDFELEQAFASISTVQKSSVDTRPLNKRQAPTEQACGPNIGSCAANMCCSADGICDDSPDSCAAPDCKFLYGPACDANAIPAGATTSSMARPQFGNIPYGGAGIFNCKVRCLQPVLNKSTLTFGMVGSGHNRPYLR